MKSAVVKSAVVTGAGGGLGRAIATELARREYAVWATGRNLARVEPVVEHLGPHGRAAVLDVTDAHASRALAAAVVARHGTLDLWVNNAGILAVGDAWDLDDVTNERVLAVNAVGTINGTVAALRRMIPTGRGQIINVVSLAGIVATPGQAVYAASKHAAMAFTLSTAFDLRRGGHRGIDVCAVCPSGVWTPLISGQADDPQAAASYLAPLLSADEVGAAVGRLTSRPRPVTIVPRRRGPMMRFVDLFPRLATPAVPALMRRAERRQDRYRQQVDTGDPS